MPSLHNTLHSMPLLSTWEATIQCLHSRAQQRSAPHLWARAQHNAAVHHSMQLCLAAAGLRLGTKSEQDSGSN